MRGNLSPVEDMRGGTGDSCAAGSRMIARFRAGTRSGPGLPAATIGPCVDDGVHGLDAVGRDIRTATGANRQIVIEITSITVIFVVNAALRRIQTIAYDASGPEYPNRRRMARETPDAMNSQVGTPVCATMVVWSDRVVPPECRS